MVIIIKKVLLFLCLFFLFNTLEVDSNSDKVLIYDKSNLYEEGYYNIYFDKVNSIKLEKVINDLDIRVLSYIIDEKKYYASNIEDLINKYTIDMDLKDKLYFENNGILIDGISVKCINSKLIEFESVINIY